MANRIFVSVQEGIEEPRWISKIEDFVSKSMERLSIDGEEVSVLFCSDSFIQNLNRDYRNIDSPTDVLSFENGEEYEDEEGKWLSAGDIAISLETLLKNAEYFEVPENTELKRLLIHGLLHINGYDHGEEHLEKGKNPECEMLSLQEKILNEFSDILIIENT